MSDEHANAAERLSRFATTAPGARKLAARMEDDPAMMAWVLARYRAVEEKDERDVAQLLQIEEYQVPHLALCRRPRDAAFADDVDTIAEHIGVDADRLTDLVRHVEVVDAFAQHRQRFGSTNPGMIAAARDRAAEDPASYDVESAPSANPAKSPLGDSPVDPDDSDDESRR